MRSRLGTLEGGAEPVSPAGLRDWRLQGLQSPGKPGRKDKTVWELETSLNRTAPSCLLPNWTERISPSPRMPNTHAGEGRALREDPVSSATSGVFT